MSLQTIDFERMKLDRNERLLDLGCGEGRHAISAYMVRDLEAVGIDLSLKDLKTTQERFEQFVEPENPQLAPPRQPVEALPQLQLPCILHCWRRSPRAMIYLPCLWA